VGKAARYFAAEVDQIDTEVQTSAVLHEPIQYCSAVPARRGTFEGQSGEPINHLKRKENASTVSLKLLSAQKICYTG
jgi:hypothetical protein